MSIEAEVVDRLKPAEVIGEHRPEEEVFVFTIHDGAQLPRHLFGDLTEEVLARPEVGEAYVRERDWGANLVAREVARALGLGGYLRVNLARVAMDYGRFPGSSGDEAPYLKRCAIYPPFHDLLPEEKKHEILGYYDEISLQLTRKLPDKRITLAIHTYDPLNASGTERPEISLVSRLLEYQIDSTVPPDAFDPLFPPVLCESTGSRSLAYKILSRLEEGGFRTALNYPYVMPVGSLEIRAQVWFFFRHLRRRFESAFPERAGRQAFDLVWMMLFDVIRRSWESELLRGYLHEYRPAPLHEQELFAEARQAYFAIRDFLNIHREELVGGYRFSRGRPSSIGIEVRKDLLYKIDGTRQLAQPHPDADNVARRIAELMAEAVKAHLSLQARSDTEALKGAVEEPLERISDAVLV